MKLPGIPEPERYVGLFVYDFGTHVSVGYTAAEVGVLRASQAYRAGTAYQIYRVLAANRLDLRGVRDEALQGTESKCFLRGDGAAARRDYQALKAAAERDPVSCPVTMRLARVYAFELPNVTSLSYPAPAGLLMSAWLARHAPTTDNRIDEGIDVHATLAQSEGIQIASCRLRGLMDYVDRTADQVLAEVDKPLQRYPPSTERPAIPA